MGIQGEFFDLGSIEAVHTATDKTAETVEPSSKRGMKDLSIPKLYYSISEVSRLTGLEQYVLRYWETEFEELRPQKNRAGNRIYSNKDIKFILRIRELLREKRYTIEGAKQILRDEKLKERELEESPEIQAEEVSKEPISDPSQLAMALPNLPLSASVSKQDLDEMRSALETLRSIFSKGSN